MISFFRFLGIRCQFGCFDFSCFLMIRLISFSFIKPLFWYQAVFADLCTIIEAFCILTNCINSFTWYFFQHPFFVPYFSGTDQINLLTRFAHLGLKSKMSVVMGHYDEVMVSNLPPEVRAGFFSSNTYFMSINTPENNSYHKQLAGLPEVTGIWPHGNGMLTNFGEGTYLCVKAFAQAAEQAKSIEAEKLVQSLETIEVLGPQGLVVMDPKTHHAAVNSYLACCNEDGTFSIKEQSGRINPEIPIRYQHKFHGTKNVQPDIPSDMHPDMHPETGAGKQQAAEFGFQIGKQVNRFKAALFIFEESGKIFFLNDTACSLVNITDSSALLNESINALLIEPDLLWQQIKELNKHWHGILQFRDTNGPSMEMQVTL
ncbi:MAG: hypothetical protein D3903_20935, partial [Candidatus Electrothrix sp. GM3_4]|nr:hypothetical protein [Candidatus Electrothrix sp. GM3_4]